MQTRSSHGAGAVETPSRHSQSSMTVTMRKKRVLLEKTSPTSHCVPDHVRASDKPVRHTAIPKIISDYWTRSKTLSTVRERHTSSTKVQSQTRTKIIKCRGVKKTAWGYQTRSKSRPPARQIFPMAENVREERRQFSRGTTLRSKIPATASPPILMTPEPVDLQAYFTFGVEMEVLVHVDPMRFYWVVPKTLRVGPRQALANALSDPKGYESFIREDMRLTLEKNYHKVNMTSEYNAPCGHEDHQKWCIATDDSIKVNRIPATNPKDIEAVIGVEIKTPILPFNDRGLHQLSDVIKLLKSQYRITSNDTCSLHVHVGIADKSGKQREIGPAICRDLAILAIVFEKELETLCEPELLSRYKRDGFTLPLTDMFRHREGWLPGSVEPTTDLRSMISQMRQTSSMAQFCHLFGEVDEDARQYSINFQNCRSESRLGTIEFRQHRGTIDTPEIINRVKLVIGLMRWAVQKGPDKARDLAILVEHLGLIKPHDPKSKPDVLGFMRGLKIDEDVVKYYATRLYRH